MRQGLLAEAAKFVLEIIVLAEPAAEAAFADIGLAGGRGDRARREQGLDGALLRRG